MTEVHGSMDTTLVFTLPDTGGYIASDRPISADSIGAIIAVALRGRPTTKRVVLVAPTGGRRCDDVEYITHITQQLGGYVYQANVPDRP